MAVALFLVALASVSVLLMVQTMHDHQNMNDRRRELNRSYHAAEAGIDLVIHWGNIQEDYTDDPELFEYEQPETLEAFGTGLILATGSLEDRFVALHTLLSEGPLEIDTDALAGIETESDELQIGRFMSSYDAGMGRIKKIKLMLPDDPDAPAIPAGSTIDPEMVVMSVGQSEKELEYTVTAWVDLAPFIAIQLPAALVSFATAAAFGNAAIHWGEAWSKANFDMLNQSQVGYLSLADANHDPWAKYRTEAKIVFPNNWSWDSSSPWNAARLYGTETGGISNLNPAAASGTANNPANQTPATGMRPGLMPTGTGNYRDAFYQDVPPNTLEWPEFASYYQEFKDYAISHGRYYTTDASGNILNADGDIVDFIEEFQADVDGDGDVTSAEREEYPFDLVFIDTTDGNPPAVDGSNLATIDISGGSPGIKGLYYICANFDATGVGNPPALTNAEKPDLSDPGDIDKIFLDGVLYAAGTAEMGGNCGVYGSVVAERGFLGGGTPNIYFNHKLKDGLELENGNVGSRFKVVLATSQPGDATEGN